MKLYIATSSLNIDNILSTECIAPYSFYEERTYGYNSFFNLELIPFKNVLILFSKIPYFQIENSEYDSRPVILQIEVNKDIIPLKYIGVYEDTTIYSTDTILHLTPFDTKFLFINPKDLNHSKLSCSDSLTNKLGERFRFDVCIPEFKLTKLSINRTDVDDICMDSKTKIEEDNKLNAIKGFIFGFYLGVSKSVSPNSAVLRKIQKRVYDIAATIKNSGSLSNRSFYEELEKLDKEFRTNDPNTIKCKDLWEKTLEENDIPIEALDKLLELYDVNSVLKKTFMRKKGLQPPVSLSQYGYNKIESYSDNLKRHTDSIIQENQKIQISSFDVLKTFDLDPTYETCMLAADDDESMIFNKFIDMIIWHGEGLSQDALRTDRFNIATEITKSTKNIWESMHWEWENSSARRFMNDLRQNIKNFTPLDIVKQENVILKSIAAFVLKGEDYDALIQFCEDNSFSDYRYVLSLWGATQGYVKMSRSIISGLTENSTFSKTYKAIIKLLYNVELEGELPYTEEQIKFIAPQKFIQSPILEEDADSLHTWQNGIKSYFEELKNVRNKKVLSDTLEIAFSEYGDQKDYVKFFALLGNHHEWKTSKGEPVKALKSMIEHFSLEGDTRLCSNNTEAVKREIKEIQGIKQKSRSLFEPIQEKETELENSKEIVEKQNKNNGQRLAFIAKNIEIIAKFIKSLNPGIDDTGYEYIIKDLNWTLNSSYSIDKSELELIEDFRSTLITGQRDPISKKGKDMTWKNKAYKPIDIEKTIDALKKLL